MLLIIEEFDILLIVKFYDWWFVGCIVVVKVLELGLLRDDF